MTAELAGGTEETRIRILDAAASAFHEQGFAATTIDDIAERVGATKGLIYYHFRSKFDIFLSVYERGMAIIRAEVEPLATAPGSGADRLTAMAESHIFHLTRSIGYHNTIHQGVRYQQSSALKPGQRQALTRHNGSREEFESVYRRVIVEGTLDGSIVAEDPGLLTRTVLSSINAIDNWFRHRDGQTEEELRDLAARIAAIVAGGVRTRRP
ncbi:TetR/AcrR family transcriptional regulator [Williamsia sp. SKLECPSW1]